MLRSLVAVAVVCVVGVCCDDNSNNALVPDILESVKDHVEGMFAGLKSEMFRGVANQALQNHLVEERLLELDVVNDAMTLLATETGIDQGAFCNSDFEEDNYPTIIVNENGQQVLQFGLVSECLSAEKEYSVSINGASVVNFTADGITLSNVVFSRVKSEGEDVKEFDEQSLLQKLDSMDGVSGFVEGVNRAMAKTDFMSTFKALLSNPDPASQLADMDKLVHTGSQSESSLAGRSRCTYYGPSAGRRCMYVRCPGQCVRRSLRKILGNSCCRFTMSVECGNLGGAEDVEDLGATGSNGKTQCKCIGEKNRDSVCTVYPDKCEHTNIASGDTVCCNNFCQENVKEGCFAADTMFVLEDGQSVLAHEVSKGDRIMSVNDEGSVVYTLVTAATAAPAQSVFDIAVRTAKGHSTHLGLTHKHMISAGGVLKFASQVEVGDEVHVVVSGDKHAQAATVESVTMQPTGPTYHITTMNHYAVANGVVSSVHNTGEKFGAAMSYLNTALYALPDSVFETVEWLMYTFALDSWHSAVSRIIA